jgi:phosphatidylserine decarboxylase
VMTFHLGSTIVLVFEPGAVRLDAAVKPGEKVRLGQVLASTAPKSSKG